MKTRLFTIFFLIAMLLAGVLTSNCSTAMKEGPRNRVAILNDAAPGINEATVNAVAEAFKRDGFETEFLSVDDVCDPSRLSAAEFYLYVIPNAKSYPIEGEDALLSYLESRGNLLVLGDIPFSNPLWKEKGQWIDEASMYEGLAELKASNMLFDFDTAETSPDLESKKGSMAEIVTGGAENSASCLQLACNLETSDTLLWKAEIEPNTIRAGDGVITFWARGDENTPQAVVQITDDLGRTGAARLLLTQEWTYFAFRSFDFMASNLGQDQGDYVDIGNVKEINIRFNPISRGYREGSGAVHQGEHTLWFDQIGSAPDPYGVFGPAPESHLPPIELVSPSYKTYALKDIESLKVVDEQAILNPGRTKLPAPKSLSAAYARPEGKGFEVGYKWRWIPLIRAFDGGGVDRGAVAWMMLNQSSQKISPEGYEHASQTLFRGQPWTPPLEGSVCAVCAISDDAALQRMAGEGIFTAMASRISDGIFLSHAGSKYFSYWPGEAVQLGAKVVNNGTMQSEVRVRISVYPEGSKKALFQEEEALTIQAGKYAEHSFDWIAPDTDSDHLIVTTELIHSKQTIDKISHELGILAEEGPSKDEYVTIEGDNFMFRGEKWFPAGANFWPSYTIGLEPDDYVYHWLAPGSYNPEEVERDLALLESIGGNFLAIRANVHNDGRNLLDFLRRCNNHDIRVMLFLQSHIITDEPHYFQGVMMPFAFQEALVEKFIQSNRLPENPALLCYDLIWEPYWLFRGNVERMFGWGDPTPYRQRWDKDWNEWIIERYGSIANAEKDWGMPAPKLNNMATSPSDEQLQKDGSWRVMVAAYRRFMDDQQSRQWNDACQKIRRMDPNHLITCRNGNLTFTDFTLTATPKHLDFFAMEGYSFRPPTEHHGNVAGFTNRYLHYLIDGKPYIWVEYGNSAWDHQLMETTSQGLDLQAKIIEQIQREAYKNGANGFAPWWWAGGYRVNERSDYGIVNPDGTIRRSGELVKEYAVKFRGPRENQDPETWFEIDRDSHPGSHPYIAFHDGADAYKQATAAGKKLGVRTPGTGTTSADTPLLAVGNTKYNGNNPPKYLNAEFNWFKIKTGENTWIEVADGATIRVPKNQAIMAKTSIGNMQDAKWLTPESCKGKSGAVYLASTLESGLKFKKAILKDTPRYKDAEFEEEFILTEGISAQTTIELQMNAEGRAWFGEKLRIVLEPIVD